MKSLSSAKYAKRGSQVRVISKTMYRDTMTKSKEFTDILTYFL